MTERIKLIENIDFRVHQTPDSQDKGTSITIWSDKYEYGVQLKQQILKDSVIVEKINHYLKVMKINMEYNMMGVESYKKTYDALNKILGEENNTPIDPALQSKLDAKKKLFESD